MCLPCWHLSPSRPFSVFSSMFVGDGKWFFLLPHSPLPRSLSLPPSPVQEAKEGEGVGGAGLPLGTAVAQSISPKPRKFLLPKRRKKKKKRKKSQRPPFLPAPLGQSRLDLWGSWEGGSGLEHSQARVVGFPAGPPPGPLWASPLPTAFPSKRPTRGGLPLPPGPWAMGPYTGAQWGYCTALERVSGGTLAPSIPCPLPAFPRAGHFLP